MYPILLSSAAALSLALPTHAEPAPPRPESSVTADRLIAHIDALPAKRAAWGDDEHKRGLREAESRLIATLKGYGYQPVLDPVDFLGNRSPRPAESDSTDPQPASKPDSEPDSEPAAPRDAPWHNIIVEIPGRASPGEILILSAHFDAVPNSPGADDDGSGVAALLEAARVLKDAPMQRTVRLILFNLEEVGLVGSRAYVERIKDDVADGTQKIVGMISADGIGYYTDAPDSQKSPIPAVGSFKPPTVGDFLGMAGLLRHRHFSQALDHAMRQREPALKTVVVDFLPIAPRDLLRSDHAPFLAIGVPAVILADTANFRNPHYHQPTDTVATLDKDRYTTAARAIIGALHTLAGPVGSELVDLAPPARPAPAPRPPPETPSAPQPAQTP